MTNNYVIPEECRAAVVVDEGPNFTIKTQTVKVPVPGPDEVLIKLNATGICYSDIHYMLNDTGGRKMSASGICSAGHEGSGVVVKLGDNVKTFQVGDRAGVKPIWNTCGSCNLCWGGKEVHCQKKVLTGVGATGTFQHYIVSPARYTTVIPEGIPDYVAAPAMCSAATAYRSIRESELAVGSWATIISGGGGVGIQAVQIAKAFGLRPIVVDTGSEKRDLSLKMGAEAFVDFKEFPDTVAEVVRLTGGIGSHGVFVTAPPAYPTAIGYIGARIGGVIMCIGLPAASSGHIMNVNPTMMILKNLSIKGTLVGTMEDTDAVLQLVQRGLVREVCEVLPFEKFPEAVDRLRRGEVAGKLVIDYEA
ncbi:Polyketide synthase, enoylreductase [Penicillium expansum]|nr:Polyketide synthase, enoylreductase [Penicillium expansum]KGO69137.1 Polyketide synthase, enoylreductase [Penicillium expansum]